MQTHATVLNHIVFEAELNDTIFFSNMWIPRRSRIIPNMRIIRGHILTEIYRVYIEFEIVYLRR